MGLHVIIGEDDYLVSQAAKKVLGEATADVIDSLQSSNEELRLADIRAADEAYRTPPFLEPRKTTWWKNVGFLPQTGGRGAPSEAVKAALEKLVGRFASLTLPDNQTFVLSGPRMLASSVFAKKLKTCAEVTVFASAKSPWDRLRAAEARAQEWAAEKGLSFSPAVLKAFVSRVGADSHSLRNELAKLDAYLGSERRNVTADDLREITSQGIDVEPEIWSVTDAIGARNVSDLVKAMHDFESMKGFAIRIANAAEKTFRQMIELKDATARGQAAAATSGLAPFAARKMQGFVAKWKLSELRVARARIVMLREKLVSSSGSADVLLLAELVRLCNPKGTAAS